MALTVSVVAGKTFGETEKITIAKLNQLGQPSITVTGATTALSDFSATAATTTGQGLRWDNDNSYWEPTSASDTILGTHIAVMVGATALTNGTQGAVPQPTTSDVGLYLEANGTWSSPAGVTGANLYNNQFLV